MLHYCGAVSFGRERVTFDVPEGTLSLTVTGTTVKKGFLYAALYDAHHAFRGKVLFEKKQKSLIIQSQHSGFGGIDGEMVAGQWTLELYNLDGEFRRAAPMEYRVTVDTHDLIPLSEVGLTPVVGGTHQIDFDYETTIFPESRWYRGDLHAHTRLSDGHNSLEEAQRIIASQALDFFFLTEHNICQPKLPVSDSCLFLPGIEITTDLGHFNVHGPSGSLDLRRVTHSSEAVIEAGLALAEKPHSSLSINHPMMKPWHWHYSEMPLERVSTLEVCCDPTWSTSAKATDQALLVLNQLWNCGHRVTAVGGSDSHLAIHERNSGSHEPSIYGDPSTFVFCDGLSGKTLLSGLRQGHVYIERCCGLQFNINRGHYLPGDDTQGQALSYLLSVSDDTQDYVAELVVDGQVVSCHTLSRIPLYLSVDAGYAWCRIDIRRTRDWEFEGCINAVFDGQHHAFNVPTVATWGELMEQMEDNEI
ncbi:CehA/McbA family metallohydrolase [Vibrio nigripulchritudo]|uniref:CehA/McbA family metallohydrolase n=1 Tax=Vibrio nigripulchritudo TaxID=28173 RepID=UPI0003B19927|nr:CehA/McbA family metallohydrolase [Vibrio nigripulchritudo]CCN85985.1 conserved hypothetical protein [Vibrio nigripulchritudo BLFn1]CCN97783.1 conserved hypothetical protein [Vibrio nigripulchritudo ENn2]CCO56094.1 conserved hypothetical protein [Vibrio nigripulchritudo Wn13]